MELRENVSLKNYTSFFIGGPARYLLFAQDNNELVDGLNFAKENNLEVLIFGGGSNMLVSDNGFNGLAIRMETVGMDIVSQTNAEIVIRVASGEVWDDVVRLACEEGWWGIENLSHIPGFCGAFPVQNVGAYGQEASDVITQVEVYDTKDGDIKFISNTDCEFGYRSSIFNRQEKNRYVILSMDLKLSKIPNPNFSYGDLKKEFGQLPLGQINILNIRNFVTDLRDKKFPFPSSPEKGNSGSFFRGLILSEEDFKILLIKIEQDFGEPTKQRLENMADKLKVAQGYKTPTGFLMELCDLKELFVGGARINPTHPAVVVNFSGEATSTDVLQLYTQVESRVLELTGVKLEIEPELIGFSREELQKYGL